MVMTRQAAVQLLRSAYEQGGFVRIKMDKRRKMIRSGWEVRLPSNDDARPRKLLAALSRLEIEPGKPYAKRLQRIIPIYGKYQVERFLQLVRPREKSHIPRFAAGKDMRLKPRRRKRPTSSKPR